MVNMVQMMQKASQMKQKMQDMQARVEKTDVFGEAGGGKVKCCVTGRFEVRSLKVDPSLIKAEEAEMMEDLIVAALNDARRKAEKMMTDETEKIMQELGLPKGMGLPF